MKTPISKEQMWQARLQGNEAGSKLTAQEKMEQMARNGAKMRPNPSYRGPEKKDDSSAEPNLPT